MENTLIKITQNLSKHLHFTVRVTSDNQYGIITDGLVAIVFEVAKYPALMKASENYIKQAMGTAESLITQLTHLQKNCNDSIDMDFKRIYKELSNPTIQYFAYTINITHNLCVFMDNLQSLAPLLKRYNNVQCGFYNNATYFENIYPFCMEIDGLKIYLAASLSNHPQYDLQTSSINFVDIFYLQLYCDYNSVICGCQAGKSKYLFYDKYAETVANLLNRKTTSVSFGNKNDTYSAIIIKGKDYEKLQSKCNELQININIK